MLLSLSKSSVSASVSFSVMFLGGSQTREIAPMMFMQTLAAMHTLTGPGSALHTGNNVSLVNVASGWGKVQSLGQCCYMHVWAFKSSGGKIHRHAVTSVTTRSLLLN